MVSNEVFCNALRASGRTGVIASEEEDLPVAVEETYSGEMASIHINAGTYHCCMSTAYQDVSTV